MARGPETEEEKKAVERFRVEVCLNKAVSEDDEVQERDWYDVSVGFFLACGLSLESAFDMAIYVRYNQHYWC